MSKKLSKEAQARLDLASQMMSRVLEQGGIPEIVIAAKTGNRKLHEVTYFIAAAPTMDKDQVKYILSRVLGLLDGRIQGNN